MKGYRCAALNNRLVPLTLPKSVYKESILLPAYTQTPTISHPCISTQPHFIMVINNYINKFHAFKPSTSCKYVQYTDDCVRFTLAEMGDHKTVITIQHLISDVFQGKNKARPLIYWLSNSNKNPPHLTVKPSARLYLAIVFSDLPFLQDSGEILRQLFSQIQTSISRTTQAVNGTK